MADLFDIAVARKLSGGGGGGGSSDFSTATMTVNVSSGLSPVFLFAYIYDEMNDVEAYYGNLTEGTHSFTIPLYKGSAYVGNELHNVSVSGAIELDGDGGAIVTGDCTITIS